MNITSKEIDAFRKDFNEVMKELEKKYDVTISLGRITYDEDEFYGKLMVKNGHDLEEIAEKDFDANVWKFEDIGLHKGMYGQMFIGKNGKRYALIGFWPNAKKYPLKIVDFETGQIRSAGKGFIKEMLNMKYVKNLSE